MRYNERNLYLVARFRPTYRTLSVIINFDVSVMNLFVGNLNPETTAEGLRILFSEFGEVVSSKIIIDKATGMPRGFGFVEMADKFHSYDAIDNLDSIFFEGNVISVKEAKQNGLGGSGGGGMKRPFKPKPRPQGGYTPRPREERPRDDFNNSRY